MNSLIAIAAAVTLALHFDQGWWTIAWAALAYAAAPYDE